MRPPTRPPTRRGTEKAVRTSARLVQGTTHKAAAHDTTRHPRRQEGQRGQRVIASSRHRVVLAGHPLAVKATAPTRPTWPCCEECNATTRHPMRQEALRGRRVYASSRHRVSVWGAYGWVAGSCGRGCQGQCLHHGKSQKQSKCEWKSDAGCRLLMQAGAWG